MTDRDNITGGRKAPDIFVTGKEDSMSDINSESRVELRRFCKNLEIAGNGYILFGVWSVVKIFMMLTMNSRIMKDLIDSAGVVDRVSEHTLKLILIAIFAAISMVILILHLFIGRSAVRYSKGRKKRRGFLVVTAIIAVILILGIPSDLKDEYGNPVTNTASALADLTVVFISVDMIYSALKTGKLRKTIENEEA